MPWRKSRIDEDTGTSEWKELFAVGALRGREPFRSELWMLTSGAQLRVAFGAG